MISQPLFYAGARQEPASGRYQDVIDPATGQVVGRTARAAAADVDAAVRSARQAFDNPAWRNLSASQRADILLGLAKTLHDNAAELIALEATSTGASVVRMSSFDLPAVIQMAMNVASQLPEYPFVQYPPIRPLPEAHHVRVVKEPLGVCALITAWNGPLLLFMLKLIPALAAGNTVVVKPAENASLSTFRLVELFNQFLPPGVVNIVTGGGAEVGDALTGHPDVAKISFTGSTGVGQHIQKRAADSLKRVTLELGGKGPSIVLPDADLELTACGASFGYLLHSGQVCLSGTRLLVPDALHDALVERMVELAGSLQPGNPLDPNTTLAPMASEAHMRRVLGYIEAGKAGGARLACGGGRLTSPECGAGFFVAPTIFTEVRNDMRIAREEIFGPVLSVIRYGDVEEAIAIANDSCYGLTAGLWSSDPVAAYALASRLQAGTVWINDWHAMTVDTPLGGYKQSGYGKELAIESIENYLQSKSILASFERKPEFKAMHSLILR